MATQIVKDTTNLLVTSDGLAACLGVTRPRVIQLANEGVLLRDGNSKYTLAENIRRYIDYVKNGGKSETDDEDGKSGYWEEKTLHERAKREMAQLRLEKYKNQIHEAVDIELMVGGMITVFKRRLTSIPHKMAQQLSNRSPDDVNELLSNEIHSALLELSLFDMSKLAEQVDLDDQEDS
jgi:phage terminase Nu1 subunit (DNA packaging protein)